MISVEAARALYAGADSAHDFDHVLRVLRLAERIARQEGADMATVRTAVLLHDVGRTAARADGSDHAEVGARMARKILEDRSAPQRDAVCEAIRTHRYRSQAAPATLEARVVFDADKLDALGAVGVARAYAHGGSQGQRLWAPIEGVEPYQPARSMGNAGEHTPVHEFVLKLSRLRDVLYTATGRRMAEERHAFMEWFFERLGAEVRGEV